MRIFFRKFRPRSLAFEALGVADEAVGYKMLALVCSSVLSAPAADKIAYLPGFGNASSWPFDAYSGFLTVPGPFELNPYDSLKIHYQFHTSQRNPLKDPLVTWHQGGPGGSSILVGLYTEMGYFQIETDESGQTNGYANPFSWNKVSNMLYLESPAGSGQTSGYSECIKGGVKVGCSWDDVSQAEAYSHSLRAFKTAFPEFADNDLYLTGESYFGQYGPNIANYILTHEPYNSSLGLKGIAAGNACWGGTATRVQCNGPNSQQNDVDMYFGKGMVSKKLYDAVYKECNFPDISARCDELIEQVHTEVGPHNVYNIYDNCPDQASRLKKEGKSMRWLKDHLRARLSTGTSALVEGSSEPAQTGGFDWSCGGMDATEKWITTPEVRAALHLPSSSGSTFQYRSSGPASVTLWPFLATKIRCLVYNGDADACVPYKGNEEWIDALEKTGTIAEKEAWRPWYTAKDSRAPSGYVTSYTVPSAPKLDFSFVTIRLAGHMVPTFQPAASLAFYQRFVDGEAF